ncbi:MAG: DUF937 domain-containing protein [Blastocatellia bacterium]
MDLTGILNDALGGDTVSQISQNIGADESSTSSAIQAALPALLGGLAHQSSTDEGEAELTEALERDQHSGVLDNLGGLISGALGGKAANGEGILGHIFGGRHQTVAQGVSQASGLDMSKVGPLLAILAPIVMGAISRAHSRGGSDSGGLAGMLGGAAQQMGAGPGLMGILGSVLGGNHSGSGMDDIAGMLGGILGGRR